MNKALLAITVLMVALSLAAGVPKALRMQQEVDFLAALGFGPTLVVILGLIQIAGGILLAFRKTRVVGAWLAGVGFGISALALLIGGEVVLALVSIVPVALVAVLGINALRGKAEAAP